MKNVLRQSVSFQIEQCVWNIIEIICSYTSLHTSTRRVWKYLCNDSKVELMQILFWLLNISKLSHYDVYFSKRFLDN